jgi:hypothetical protein
MHVFQKSLLLSPMKRKDRKRAHKTDADHVRDVNLLRTNKRTILFNNKEIKAIDDYCMKYAVHNRSKFMREVIISAIIKKFEDDYPTLF